MTKTAESTDDLLALINGDPALPPRVDAAPDAAPNRADELRVLAPAPLAPVEAVDAKHSLKAGGKGYRVKVRGLYYAPNPEGKGKVKRPYEVEVNVGALAAAGSTIKNKLLLPALKAKYPDAVRHRTFHIVSATPLSPDTAAPDDLAYMTRAQLESVARQYKVPIDLTAFSASDVGTTQLRESLIDHRQNPKDFKVREAARAVKRRENAELAELNPDLTLGSEAD